jgi:endoglucanase
MTAFRPTVTDPPGQPAARHAAARGARHVRRRPRSGARSVGSACLVAAGLLATTLTLTDQPAGASSRSAVVAHPQPVLIRPAAARPRQPASAPLPAPAPLPASAPLPATLWVDPASPATRARNLSLSQGQVSEAGQLAKISSRPTSNWLTGTAADSVATVNRVYSAIGSSARVPTFVLYHLPQRDCGGFSAGGAAGAADYQAWIRSVAGAIGSHPALVIVEPDAVAMAASRSCASATTDTQTSLLAYAVTSMHALPGTRVYLDAGNSGWVSNLSVLAARLRAAGIGAADGFSLNVSNFRTLGESTGYGNRLAQLVGKHYVIDTSRNGSGPLPAGSGYAGPSWCNPPGRSLGVPPTLQTGQPLVDGYLWVKYPGASDGSCGLGDPGAGNFWLDYALGLAQRAN